MAGNKNSGRDDIFTQIRDAYVKSDPTLPIYQIGLDKKLVEVLERWIFIDQIRSRDYPKKNTKDLLNIYRRKYGLSERQFFEDKKHTERLFGPMVVINKDYEKKLAIESLDAIFNMAFARNDLKTATEAIKNKINLMGLMDKETDSSNESGPKKYIMQTNIILDGKIVNRRNIDITNLQNLDIMQLKELSQAIDIPEASMQFMEDEIDKLTEGNES